MAGRGKTDAKEQKEPRDGNKERQVALPEAPP